MNERIKELAKQCGYWSGQTIEMNNVGIEKFAELIVEECADINFRHKIGLSSDQDYDVRTTIKEHFGVE